MALIKCPECGKNISDRAPTCIHCGCPVEPQPANQNIQPVKVENECSKCAEEMKVESVQSTPKKVKTKKKSRKILIAVIIVLCLAVIIPIILILTKHEHTWQPATCTVPNTCAECGETEGVALGHFDNGKWVDDPSNSKQQMLLCDRCDKILEYREYQVMSADGVAWTLGDIPDVLYDKNGFLISCNDFMGVFAKALTEMPDKDEYATQLNWWYDSECDIKIMRKQLDGSSKPYESLVSLSFEGNDNLDEPMTCVSLCIETDKLLSNYTSYRMDLLYIFGALPYALDNTINSIEEGKNEIVQLFRFATGGDIDQRTVTLRDGYIPVSSRRNGISYTLFEQNGYLYVIASIGACDAPITSNDFIVAGDCVAGESNDVIANLNRRNSNMMWVYYDASTDPSKSGVITTARGIQLGDSIFNVLAKYGDSGYLEAYGRFSTNCRLYQAVPYELKQRVKNDCYWYLSYPLKNVDASYNYITFFFNRNNELTFVAFGKQYNPAK